jgi:hypothetical protein
MKQYLVTKIEEDETQSLVGLFSSFKKAKEAAKRANRGCGKCCIFPLILNSLEEPDYSKRIYLETKIRK